MTISPRWLEHKTLMIAMLLIAKKIAEKLEVEIDTPAAAICRKVGANRTAVYEQVGRIKSAIERLLEAQPGRPVHQAPEPEQQAESQRLIIEVLKFQLRHPGSLCQRNGRTRYAAVFERFILERHDAWQGSDQAFAQAVDVPVDTLRDWLRRDREGLVEKASPKVPVKIPRCASELTGAIASAWQSWVGSTRDFLRHAAKALDVSPNQTIRVLKILGLVASRSPKPFRYRKTTCPVSPGTLLVTDAKRLCIRLTGTHRTTYRTWQAMVDQTTGCDTASVVTGEEHAQGVLQAYQDSRGLLGFTVPQGLVHDNKPCYRASELQEQIRDAGTDMIPATLQRPENKALLEGAFGLFEQRVGTLRLDDSSEQSLIHSAVKEVIRAYTGATNGVARVEFDGKSRLRVLREACPGPEEKEKDRDFLRKLKARHPGIQRRVPEIDPQNLKLLDEIFARLGLLDNDPRGSLRRHLASYEGAAIRSAGAIVAAKLDRGSLKRKYAHRYLAKVIRSQQEQLDLFRAASELFELCRSQNEDWTEQEDLHYQSLVRDFQDRQQLTRAVAERAAHGGIPLQEVFWTQKLVALLQPGSWHLIENVKKYLIRLYEAPFQNRLALLERITALQWQLA